MPTNPKCAGFIFLMTLLTMLVISLLVLSSMQHNLVYFKALNALFAQEEQRQKMEGLAQKLLASGPVISNPNCIRHQDIADTVMNELLQSNVCSIDSQYRYLVEDLGVFPCLVVRYKGKKYATTHRRVSVLWITDDQGAKAFIQLRSIMVSNNPICEEGVKEVSLGVSSWRFIGL